MSVKEQRIRALVSVLFFPSITPLANRGIYMEHFSSSSVSHLLLCALIRVISGKLHANCVQTMHWINGCIWYDLSCISCRLYLFYSLLVGGLCRVYPLSSKYFLESQVVFISNTSSKFPLAFSAAIFGHVIPPKNDSFLTVGVSRKINKYSFGQNPLDGGMLKVLI